MAGISAAANPQSDVFRRYTLGSPEHTEWSRYVRGFLTEPRAAGSMYNTTSPCSQAPRFNLRHSLQHGSCISR
jgi:hypothetical protein